MHKIICDCILFEIPELSKMDIYNILHKTYYKNYKSLDMFFYLKNRNLSFKMKYKYIKEISLLKNIFLFRKVFLPLFLINKNSTNLNKE